MDRLSSSSEPQLLPYRETQSSVISIENHVHQASPRSDLLRQLQRRSAGKRPCRPLFDVIWDFRFLLVAQEVEREPHRWEVDLLQQAGKERRFSVVRSVI